MSRTWAKLAIANFVLVAVALAGCTATESNTIETPAVAASPEPTRTAAVSPSEGESARPSLRPDFATNIAPDRCSEGGYAVDSGPAAMANGTVETDAEGRPVVYIVAQGDAPQAIQERLCITHLMERNGLNRYIQPGERLTIDPKSPVP